jgi:hypothetical protein
VVRTCVWSRVCACMHFSAVNVASGGVRMIHIRCSYRLAILRVRSTPSPSRRKTERTSCTQSSARCAGAAMSWKEASKLECIGDLSVWNVDLICLKQIAYFVCKVRIRSTQPTLTTTMGQSANNFSLCQKGRHLAHIAEK